VTYPSHLQFLNDWASVSAFVLGASMLVFLGNFIWSLLFARVPAAQNPWGSLSLEWQLPSPVPVHDFDEIPVITGDPYGYGNGGIPVVAVPAPAPAGGGT
jgi:cytochrome c oxidase subunit 1